MVSFYVFIPLLFEVLKLLTLSCKLLLVVEPKFCYLVLCHEVWIPNPYFVNSMKRDNVLRALNASFLTF